MSEPILIYTDGGADPNPGIGGWAAILKYGRREKLLSGNEPDTTNNRMELQAAISALQALKRPCQISFYTDSEYLRQGITQWIDRWEASGWKRKGGKPVPNVDLWQKLQRLVKQHDIDWHWVKGHAGDPLNERVDQLARQARLAITPSAQLSDDIPKVYLRASCKGNPGPGGWGVVVETGADTQQASGSALETTNNRMEITAAIEGLLLLPPGSAVQMFTTSDYLFQGVTRWIHGWRQRAWKKKDGKSVANVDLWQALDRLMKEYAIRWVNAKGQEQPALLEAGKLAVNAVEIA
jgi:ribonuclease HI